MTYERHSMTFLTDYNRANPMTSKEAYMEYYDKLKEAGEIDSKKYEQQRNIFNNAGRFGGVINYGQASNTLQTRVQSTYQGSVFGFLANQQIQSQNYGYHQMNVVPRRYIVKAIIPSNQVYTRGYYPVPNTSSSVYNYSNFISRAGVINANAAPNIQMKVQQATNIVYKSPQPAIQPTYAAPQRVNLAPTYSQPQVVYNQPQAVYNQPQAVYNQPIRYASPAPQPQYYTPGVQYQSAQPQVYSSQVAYKPQTNTLPYNPIYQGTQNDEED